MTDATHVLDALAARPGGPQLLALGRARDDLALVGGAVRDLLLERAPRELDVALDADAEPVARELAEALGASVTTHERFGTALVEWEAGRIDIARRRAEFYPAPGALPQVRPGTIEEDLRRRDFTVNAISVALGGPRRGRLDSAQHALEDLARARLRVLHERSFVEDPTRLLRLARYRARLGFDVDASTARLAAEAVAGGALASVSRARVGAELRLALREAGAPAALAAIDSLGVLAALHPRMRFDARLARAALELLHIAAAPHPDAPRADLLLLAVLIQPLGARSGRQAPGGGEGEAAREDAYTLLNELELPAAERDRAIHDAACAQATARALARAHTPSQVYRAASRVAPEGVALAGAWGELRSEGTGIDARRAGAAAREWLAELRGVSLQIDGDDLIAAGVPEGPEIRRRLEAALLRKLDRQLDADGPEAELSAALAASA